MGCGGRGLHTGPALTSELHGPAGRNVERPPDVSVPQCLPEGTEQRGAQKSHCEGLIPHGGLEASGTGHGLTQSPKHPSTQALAGAHTGQILGNVLGNTEAAAPTILTGTQEAQGGGDEGQAECCQLPVD